jgi:hypothetical protein
VRIVDAGTVALRATGVTARYAVTFANASVVIDVYRIVCLRSNLPFVIPVTEEVVIRHSDRPSDESLTNTGSQRRRPIVICTCSWMNTKAKLHKFWKKQSDVTGELNFISFTRLFYSKL